MVLVTQFTLSKIFTFKSLVIKDYLAPYSVGIKPNFVAVPYLSGSWLDIIEIRSDDHFSRYVDFYHHYQVSLQILS